MDESQAVLSRACLLLFLLGLGLIYVASLLAETPIVTTNDLSTDQLGQHISIQGVAKEVSYRDGHLFFSLEDEYGRVRVVWFNAPEQVAASSTVTVSGVVQIYRGELEIIADDVKKKT